MQVLLFGGLRAHAKENASKATATADYHFSMAQAYSADGESDRAIEEYKAALNFDAQSALIHSRIATEYIKKGSLSTAMEYAKKAVELDPKYTDARLMLGGIYSALHENTLALKEYDVILVDNPQHEEAVIYKAQVLVEEAKLDEAGKVLQAFAAKNDDSAVAWYYLGRVEERREHFKEAVQSYQKALLVRPSFTQAGLALGYAYESKGMSKEAVDAYKKTFDRTQDPAAAGRLATLFLKEEKYELALPYLEAAAAEDPEDLNTRVKLGLVQMELKKYDSAIKTFEEILVKNPEAERVYYYLGSIYEEKSQFDKAIAQLRKIPATSKLYEDAVLHVTYLYRKQKRSSDAMGFLDEAITKSPRTPSFYIFAASLQEDERNVDRAIEHLKKGLKHFPEHEKIRYYLGSLYDKKGDLNGSLEQMQAILKVNPENAEALNYVGYTWTTQGVRLEEAGQLIRKALKLKPENAYIQDSWGWYLYIAGRYSESLVELEKAVKLKPDEATILEHLGDAYARQNLNHKAAEQYAEAMKHMEDAEHRGKIQSKLNEVRKMLAGADKSEERLPASSETGSKK